MIIKQFSAESLQKKDSFFDQATKVINQLTTSLLAIFFVMFLTWLLLLGVSKYDGGQIFKVFFYDPFNSAERMKKILAIFAPFLIGSIAVWICLRMGLINLGVGGQMSFAALSVYFGVYFLKKTDLFVNTETPLLWLPLLFFIGIFAATFLSLFCGILKVYFNVNEVLSTIFTNYIVFYIFRYLISLEKIVDSSTKLRTGLPLGDSIGFNTFVGILSVIFFLAIFIYVLFFFVFKKTKTGFQFQVIGYGNKIAKYSGINVKKMSILVFLIAGVLAGIAGIFYYYRNPDNTHLYKSEALPNNGFDTISIVWLSQSSFYALPFVSFFVALIRTQQKVIKISSIDPVIVEVIIGFMILFVAFFTHLSQYGKNYQKKWFITFWTYFTKPQLLYTNSKERGLIFWEKIFGISELNHNNSKNKTLSATRQDSTKLKAKLLRTFPKTKKTSKKNEGKEQ